MKRVLILATLCLAFGASAAPKAKKKPKPAPVSAPSAPTPAPATPEPAPEATPAVPAPTTEAPPPAPTPPPAPPPTAKETKETKATANLDAINNEYHQLRDELFRSRAKAEMLGAALFKTRLVTTFQYKAQRAWPLKKVSLRLDNQPVYAADSPQAEDPTRVYEGTLAPGRHTLTVRVETGATGESRLGYTAENTFNFDAPDGKQTRLDLVVDEVGDGPAPIAKSKGEFDVRVRARVRALELDAK